MDKYLSEMEGIADNLEELCGLSISKSNGGDWRDSGIEDVLNFCLNESQKLPAESVKALNASVGRKIVLLSYVNERLKFYNKKKLDFSWMPCMSEVAKTLLPFTQKSTVTPVALNALDKCILVLSDVDNRNRHAVDLLGYRYLRLFLVLVSYNFLCSASIVADFILSQLIVREE